MARGGKQFSYLYQTVLSSGDKNNVGLYVYVPDVTGRFLPYLLQQCQIIIFNKVVFPSCLPSSVEGTIKCVPPEHHAPTDVLNPAPQHQEEKAGPRGKKRGGPEVFSFIPNYQNHLNLVKLSTGSPTRGCGAARVATLTCPPAQSQTCLPCRNRQ